MSMIWRTISSIALLNLVACHHFPVVCKEGINNDRCHHCIGNNYTYNCPQTKF